MHLASELTGVGISFATTWMARRSQLHRSILATHEKGKTAQHASGRRLKRPWGARQSLSKSAAAQVERASAFGTPMTPSLSNDDVREIRGIADWWTAAVEAGDIEQLAQLMTDDIVVIHGNGRLVCGRTAVMKDFACSLQDFSVRQTVESEETIVAGEWAFERATVHTSITPRRGGATQEFDSRSLTILRKQTDLGWCVARVIGVIFQKP